MENKYKYMHFKSFKKKTLVFSILDVRGSATSSAPRYKNGGKHMKNQFSLGSFNLKNIADTLTIAEDPSSQ